ncbi:MAG: ATPase [Taibaiella sp.]|nr:ATPase [Taibaiella sp.]
MKFVKFLAALIVLFTANDTIHAQTRAETIKVSGNCGSCKKHIEKAAKQAGATIAEWNQDTKVLKVSYDEKKTSNDNIQKKIASVGYDTEKYTGDDKAYNALDECCQYDRKNKK